MCTSNEAIQCMDSKANKLNASLMAIMNKPNEKTTTQEENSPPSKQYCHDIDRNANYDDDN
jgi:hypothetical protein